MSHDRTVPSDPPQGRPSPDLSPEEVVTKVLLALAANDLPEPDHGASVLYAFASDSLRAGLGQEADAARTLHNSRYQVLLDHDRATLVDVVVRGDAARSEVVVTAPDGVGARFTMTLTRAVRGERRGCWLLSGVAREGVDL